MTGEEALAALAAKGGCAPDGEAVILPDAKFLAMHLQYARCGTKDDEIEARLLTAQANPDDVDAEDGAASEETLVHLRLKAETYALQGGHFSLSFRKLVKALGKPSTQTAVNGILTASWRLTDSTFAIRATCLPVGGECFDSSGKLVARLAEVSAWLD
jgi:hypothetical protein